MQAIQTRYFGPGNVRGARIIATCAAKRMSFPYRHDLNADENHALAADLLRDDMGWVGEGYGDTVSGCLQDGSYAHVMTERKSLS